MKNLTRSVETSCGELLKRKKKMHLVGWNKIIKPKEEGGSGIQATNAKNIALLAKLNWRMFHERESLWAKTSE